MLGGSQPNAISIPSSDSSAFTTCDKSLAVRVSSDNKPRKARPFCDHCTRPGHIRELCWKLHGSHQIRSQLETPKIPPQMEIRCLSHLLHRLPPQVPPHSTTTSSLSSRESSNKLGGKSTSIGPLGNSRRALHVSSENPSAWIVDSRASEHMTGN